MEKYIYSLGISLIGLCFLAFNTVFSLYLINKIKTKLFKMLPFYLVAMLVIETFCHVIGILKPGSNFFISHFYFNIQFIILTLFFAYLFKKNKNISRNIIIISTLIFILILLTYKLNYVSFMEFNLFEISITSFTIIAYVFYYFKYNYEKTNVQFTYFFSGLSIYLISSCLIFLSGNTELIIFEEPFIDIWVLNSLLYILFQYFVLIELKTFKKLDLV